MGMRRALDRIQEDEPGARFVHAFERHKIDNYALRMVVVGLGVALMFAAAVTFWLPGPNFVLVLAGLALVGAQSRTVAGWMDSGEMLLRTWHDEVWEPFPHKRLVYVGFAFAGAMASLTLLWLSYRFGLLPACVSDRISRSL
jgi:hypothetical protein